jgi:hypothetical protein
MKYIIIITLFFALSCAESDEDGVETRINYAPLSESFDDYPEIKKVFSCRCLSPGAGIPLLPDSCVLASGASPQCHCPAIGHGQSNITEDMCGINNRGKNN